MIICTHGNPVRPGSKFTNDQCRVCWFAAKKGRIVADDRKPCGFIGEQVSTAFCAPCGGRRRELPVFSCAIHGTCTVQTKADGHGCCTGCGDYSAPVTPGSLVALPPIPEKAFAPRSDKCLVTVVSGAPGWAMHHASRASQAAYAKAIGADYVILSDYHVPQWPIFAKFGLSRVFGAYSRIAYFDADVVPSRHSPDIFAVVPPGSVGAFNDLPYFLPKSPGLINEYNAVVSGQGYDPVPLRAYWNTGIFVADSVHERIFAPPAKPVPAYHCSEQHIFVRRMLDANVVSLPRVFNYQGWLGNGWVNGDYSESPPVDAILHVSGWNSTLSARVAAMRKYADHPERAFPT